MNTAEIDRRDATFVIAKTAEGYRVCSPLTPATQYVVTGVPDAPQCTCQEFQNNEGDPEYLCSHIVAVLRDAAPLAPSGGGTPPANNGGVPTGGRGAAQPPPAPTEKKPPGGRNGNGAVMVLKRSVSPDGRIDSLSVEFSCPVGKNSLEELKVTAERILVLQGEIVSGFLKANRRTPPPNNGTAGTGQPQNGNGATPAQNSGNGEGVSAQLIAVGSMNSKYGKRLFLNVLVNGQVLKFFGSDKQLGEAVSAAGYPGLADHIVEGYTLNLPCRVVTKPSPDGKYTNVDRVLPPQAKGA